MIIGWDLGSHRSGWCAGTGADTPLAGAVRLDNADPGRMGAMLMVDVRRLQARFGAKYWIVERPLIARYRDKVQTLVNLYGLFVLLATYAAENGIVFEAPSFAEMKRELTGSPKADKAAMVRMAIKLGVRLPEKNADGREDAADALAAWLIGVRLFARQHQGEWDRRVYGRRGGML